MSDTSLVYENKRKGTRLHVPWAAVSDAHVKDGKGREFIPSRKPARGVILELSSETESIQFKLLDRGSTVQDVVGFVLRRWAPVPNLDPELTALADHQSVATWIAARASGCSFEGYEHLSLERWQSVASHYAMLAHRFPRVAARIGTVRIGKIPRKKKRCMGVAIYSVGRPVEIVLSVDVFRSGADAVGETAASASAATCFWPSGTGFLNAVLTHEFGHAIRYIVINEYGLISPESEVSSMLPKDSAASVSRYAKTSPDEQFAETFSMVVHSPEERWPESARSLARQLERWFGGPGSFRLA